MELECIDTCLVGDARHLRWRGVNEDADRE
jgi:hypothetical protein